MNWVSMLYGGYGNRTGQSQLASERAQKLVRGFIHGVKVCLAGRKVDVTPWLALRIDDAVMAYAVVVELERELHDKGLYLEVPPAQKGATIKDGAENKGNNNPDNSEPKSHRLHPAVETSAKARERFRKALKELEDAIKLAGGGGDSVAEELEPVIKKTEQEFAEAYKLYEPDEGSRANRTNGGAANLMPTNGA